jgi:hypothetical protein
LVEASRAAKSLRQLSCPCFSTDNVNAFGTQSRAEVR